MILRYLILLNFVCLTTGWGLIGHGLVARLAQSVLSNTANEWVNEYIPNDLLGNLDRIASWPDWILYADSNPYDYKRWQWSHALHFIDTPDWNCTYIPSRDCVNNICVHGAIQNYSSRLISEQTDYIEQQQALFFLVHFVGDVHQPLHTGFKGDFGGNAVKVHFMNQQNLTNLHSVWDDGIIQTRIDRHFNSNIDSYYQHLHMVMVNRTIFKNETPSDIVRWINESLEYVCEDVYIYDGDIRMNSSKIFNLTDLYFDRNWALVDQRLVQAGFRLGLLLNELSVHRSSFKLAPRIQVLIITLCSGFFLGILVSFTLFCLHQRYQTYGRPLLSDES